METYTSAKAAHDATKSGGEAICIRPPQSFYEYPPKKFKDGSFYFCTFKNGYQYSFLAECWSAI